MTHKITFTLLIIGGINWLLEAFGWGIGQFLPLVLAQTVYILIGLSAIYELAIRKKMCKICNPSDQQ